jgi:serine/threonine-protein kinase HipA
VADSLEIWLYGMRVAVVEQNRQRLRLEYTAETRAEYEGGTPLLSLSLPVSAEVFGSGTVRPFLDGLLPEGDPLLAIAAQLGLRANDTFGLIGALGRDCAGAIVIQPAGDPPPAVATTTTAEPLDDDQLIRLVSNLRTSPLGAGERVRISLGGAQEKLLLTKMPNGGWGRPVDGTPSTHILKPEIRGYPHSVENEFFCMRMAKYLGIPVANVATIRLSDRPLLVVSRYDRTVGEHGGVERIHQEDFCQALGLPPTRKYEEDGGPTLRMIATTLGGVDPDSLSTLLSYVVVQVLVGNGDAHAKNYSLLHNQDGTLSLAPLYDVMSTLYYKLDRLAMYVDQVQRLDRITKDRVIREATTWGMSRVIAERVVDDLLERAAEALVLASDDTPGLPAQVAQIVDSQLKRLRGS